jgi:hypothetical protein
MVAAGDIGRIAELCRAIGNDATDDSGFVAVRHLLARFQADLLIRPLLVEGMLASAKPASISTSSPTRWTVLVDSEKYPFTQLDVDEERPTRPLPHRMRNTVAHELVHSLAFRTMEFGVRLKTNTDRNKSLREFVSKLEEETERLSPLLLWSEKAIGMLLKGRKEKLSLADLIHVMDTAGISRYVLVNRLILLGLASDSGQFLFSTGLRNLAVGMGVWGARTARLKGWPLFCNFDNGIVPAFLLSMHQHECVPAESLFSDSNFAMLGGPNNVVDLRTSAGTRAVPNAKEISVQISVEQGLRRENEEFLFVVRGSS